MANDIDPALFNILGNINIKQKLLQSLYNVAPTISSEDVRKKIKQRYFAKYASQRYGTIYELDGGQYNAIKDNNLFQKTTIDWIIRGKMEDTILTLPSGDNILVKGVISQNRELLAIAETEVPGITNHLRNYLEFWSGE